MANTKVTGDLIASGTITAANLVSGTLDSLLNTYLTTNTYATESYVTTAVNNLIDAAPASLDTLNELAAALNDDANFATTVTNSLATKLNLSGGTISGNLQVTGTILDSSGDAGTSGQLLSSTATGTNWIDAPTTGIDGTGTANYLMKWLDADTATDSIIYDNGTNIGIGTSSPVNISGYTTLDIRNAANGSLLYIGKSGTDSLRFIGEGVNAYIDNLTPTGSLLFRTNNATERMRIDSSGNLNLTTSEGELLFYSDYSVGSTDRAKIKVIGAGGGSGYGGDLTFHTKNTSNIYSERMRIDSSGNVGIGTSNPLQRLDVKGSHTTGSATAAWFGSSNASNSGLNGGVAIVTDPTGLYGGLSSLGTGAGLKFETSSTERMRITTGGYLKFTDIGSYNDVNRPENEIQSNQTVYRVLQLTATNASFVNDIIQIRPNRSSSSTFSYLTGYSLGSADTDFRLRGDGIGYSDGGWTTPASDYAEYFETLSGASINRGVTVVMDGDKVRPATESDDASKIIGIIRPKEDGYTAGIVGGASNQRWNKKYLTDDFGVYLREEHNVIEWTDIIIDEEGNEKEEKRSYESHNIPADVVVPDNAVIKTHDENGNKFDHRKLNPDYDETLEYTPREQRDEWVIVGLLGQVPMLKGQPVNPNWIKMKDISETVELWFIK